MNNFIRRKYLLIIPNVKYGKPLRHILVGLQTYLHFVIE
jgi:hypothetical protein